MSCNNGMSFFPSSFMIQNSYEDDHPHQSPSLAPLLPSCSLPQDLNGFASFIGKQMLEEEYSDDGSQMGEKKRRLNMEQVQTLEKAFELGNKLEPERKTQLARALGLQPRQIAIWFQNRRARWKTKQLEKDYDTLKLKFDALKAENDRLQTHNQKLQAEIMGLQNKEQTESINLNKETEGSCSNRSDNLYATASINRKHNNGRSPTADSWSTLLPTVTSHRNDHNNDVAVLPKLVFRTEYG